MRKTFLFALILLLGVSFTEQSNAQLFKAYYAKTDSFPNLSIRYLARATTGEPFAGLTRSDFRIKENGVLVDTNLYKLNCTETLESQPASFILLTDFTGSMNESVGANEYRRDWIKAAVRKFLDTMKLDGSGACNIVPFSTQLLPQTGFRTNKDDLYYWLDNDLPPFQGLTNFNPPFTDPTNSVVNLMKTRPANLPRVVIMITDGYHEQQTKFDHQSILANLLSENIILFTIAIQPPTTADQTLSDLFNIATRTGGRATTIWTKADLIKYFNLVAWEVQGKRSCRLEYKTNPICFGESNNIEVEVELKQEAGFKSTFNYTVPEKGIRKIESDKYDIVLGKSKTSETAKVAVTNATFKIDSVKVSPEGEDLTIDAGSFPKNINSGSSFDITINYTDKPSSLPRLYDVTVFSSPCNTDVIKVVAPCGGQFVENVDLGDIMVGLTGSKTIVEAFVNNTPIEIKGNVSLKGANADQFDITTGAGAFTLQPGAKHEVAINFTPNALGNKIAILDFGIENSAICGNAEAELTGNGIPNSVEDELNNEGYLVGSVNPNPASGIASLNVTAENRAKAEIGIKDAEGRNVINLFDSYLSIGDNQIEINTESLASGIYYATVTINGKTVIRKIAVVK